MAAPDVDTAGTAPYTVLGRAAGPLVAAALAAVGLALRLADFGREDFWNDEAWVALSTRAGSLEQFWLSIAVTPPLWAASLQPLAVLPAPPEMSLRLLPLLFGMLTLAAAYWAGSEFAGHVVGGVAAVAVLAGDPLSVAYSGELKHYTAETFFCLLAFGALLRCTRTERLADLVALSLVLLVGMPFANSQLLVAPAVLGALLVSTAARQRRFAVPVAVTASAVAGLELAYFRLALASRMQPSLVAYWERGYAPGGSFIGAARFVYEQLAGQLAAAWGPAPAAGAILFLGATALRGTLRRTAGLALVLAVATVAVASSRRAMPLSEPRVILFLLTCLVALAAASLGLVARGAWGRPALRPSIAAATLVAAAALAWRAGGIGPAHVPEGLGSLVRAMERDRRPGDGVLLYERSGYVYAYYQRNPPVLVEDAALTVGYHPRLDDPALLLIDGRTPEATVEHALGSHARIWLLGSRFRDDDEERILKALGTRATTLAEQRRPRALLILAEGP